MRLDEFIDKSVIQITGKVDQRALFGKFKEGKSYPVDLKRLLGISFVSEKIFGRVTKDDDFNIGEYLTEAFRHSNLMVVTRESDARELFKIMDEGFFKDGAIGSPSVTMKSLVARIPHLGKKIIEHSLGRDFEKASLAWSLMGEEFRKMGLLLKSKVDIATTAGKSNKNRLKSFYNTYSDILGSPAAKDIYFAKEDGEALKVSFLNLKFGNDLLIKKVGSVLEYTGIGGIKIQAKPEDFAILVMYHELGHILTSHSQLEEVSGGLTTRDKREIFADIFASLMCMKKRGPGIIDSLILPLREFSQSAAHRTSTYIEEAIEFVDYDELRELSDAQVIEYAKNIFSKIDFKKVAKEHAQKVLYINLACKKDDLLVNNRDVKRGSNVVSRMLVGHIVGMILNNRMYVYDGEIPLYEKESLVRESLKRLSALGERAPEVGSTLSDESGFGAVVSYLNLKPSSKPVMQYSFNRCEQHVSSEMYR